MRQRLFIALTASTLLVWLGVSWLLHGRQLHEVDEIYDAELQQSGRVLVGIVRARAGITDLAELQAALPHAEFDQIPQFHAIVDRELSATGKYERLIGFQVASDKGEILFRTPGAPASPLSDPRRTGFSDREIEGVRWRVCSFFDRESGRTFHLGEQYAVREELSRYLLHSMVLPVVLGILAVGVLIWLSLDWGLRPLSDLARQVRDRRPGDLSAVEPSAPAKEIRPIVDALNDLLARLRHSFESERRFIGDAAHELRTPLAVLRVQSQVALGATGDQEREKALKGVLAGVDRAAHLISQLLDMSRLDWQQRPEADSLLDLYELTYSVAEELMPYARERSVDISGTGEAGTHIRAGEALVASLACNLLDNAIRYSEPGGQVTWSVRQCSGKARLEILDNGPGIPKAERQKVFDRFHRMPASRGNGAGLGLSIVQKIADLYGADISLDSAPEGAGLRVVVAFPLISAALVDAENSESPWKR